MIVPWRDRHGRFLPLKAAVLAAGFIPGAVLAFWWATGALGGRPVTEVIHGTGDWAIRYLLISLAITPAARVLNWPRLLTVRRIVGLTTLAYALSHLTLYTVDQNFRLGVVASEIVLRFYLTIGFIVLAGPRSSWRHVDQWLEPAARPLVEAAPQGDLRARGDRAAALLHPVEVERVGTGVFLWSVRLAAAVACAADGLAAQPAVQLGLAVVAACVAAGIEFAWYALATGINPWRVLAASETLRFGLRPAHYVALAGLAVVVLAALRRIKTPMWLRGRLVSSSGAGG